MPLPPVKNNVTNHVLIQPQVGGAQGPANIAPVPNPPPLDAPAGNADAAAAQALIRSLDVLLSRAGKAAGQAVDEAALAKLAKGAKFDKVTVTALRTTAKAANEAMRVLDSFTGEDFVNAMKRNSNDPDSCVVEWDENSYVGKAVENALDKQQALSDVLSTLLNNLPATATAEQQAALEEAMLQCDRRCGEIETVVLELTELVANGPDRIDGKTQAALGRRVVDLAGEKALQMHDRSLAIATFREQLEKDGKVYRAEDWESDEVQNGILHAEPHLDPTAPIMGKAPTNQQGRTLISDYKYMTAGNLYARDFDSWENNQ